MKKIGIINRDISDVVASMGHFDTLTVGDAGLPISDNVRRIDLAVRKGVPGFLETVETIATELRLEGVIIAQETFATSPHIADGLKKILGDTPVRVVSHEELKALTGKSKAVVRTGEFTPYANVILVSGVVF